MINALDKTIDERSMEHSKLSVEREVMIYTSLYNY